MFTAPDASAGSSAPIVPPVAIEGEAPAWADPTAELQAQPNDARLCIVLLEGELELTQQATIAFSDAFEGAKRELKVA
jgi:hypothetical protein